MMRMMNSRLWQKSFKTLDSGIDFIARYLLVSFLFIILFLSLATIVLRWMQIPFNGIDSLMRHLVFASIFLGAVIAVSKRGHMGLDFLSRYLEKKKYVNLQKFLLRFIDLVGFLTLLWLFRASLDLTVLEWNFGRVEFLKIHSGFLVGIIPVGFIMIAYRFFYLFIKSFFKLGSIP